MIKWGSISLTVKSLRVADWWESKFGPLFGTIYASSVLFQIPFIELFPFLIFLLIALLPGASFVSVINDFTDLEEDKIAGKANRLNGKSRLYAQSLIFICLAIGLIISLFLSRVSFFLYLCAWIVFTLYSVPPIRLKKRGFWGVLADTLGANVFPQLFAISVLANWYRKDIDIVWFYLVGIWTFSLGLRGILSHQLVDKENDQKAGVKTFAQNHNTSLIKQIAALLIYPIEIAAFFLMLYYTRSNWSFSFLGLYIFLTILIYYSWKIRFVFVLTSKDERLLMSDYYFIFYPISFLLTGMFLFPYTWVVMILHLLLFSRSIYLVCLEIYQLLFQLVPQIARQVREFLFGY